MKKLLLTILLFSAITSAAQIQEQKPYRWPHPNQAVDSAMSVRQLRIPTFISPTLNGYADKRGQSFGLNTTNKRLSIRGVNEWLEFPSMNDLIGVVKNNQTNTYVAGAKQTFAGGVVNSGIGFGGGLTANPSALVTGDFWFRSDEGKFRYCLLYTSPSPRD